MLEVLLEYDEQWKPILSVIEAVPATESTVFMGVCQASGPRPSGCGTVWPRALGLRKGRPHPVEGASSLLRTRQVAQPTKRLRIGSGLKLGRCCSESTVPNTSSLEALPREHHDLSSLSERLCPCACWPAPGTPSSPHRWSEPVASSATSWARTPVIKHQGLASIEVC